ncbi:MAG TPA: ATP-binding cassette domain-containing protein, partial [bacterium]|nr:ATP-binding cassette domain-containing protein [bacterium]
MVSGNHTQHPLPHTGGRILLGRRESQANPLRLLRHGTTLRLFHGRRGRRARRIPRYFPGGSPPADPAHGGDPVILEAAQLSKWYGPVIGVNNLSFTIGPGVTGFLGPNGAGKSTLLKLMTGQLRPSKGTVRIDSRPVWNNPGINTHLGYCPEQDAFWRFLTGWEFV